MNIKELKEKLNFYEKRLDENDPVVIELAEPSVGTKAHCDVENIATGIDWDMGKLWIYPKKKLLSYEKDRDIPQMAYRITYTKYPGSKKQIKCPKCESHLRKTDKYCSNCGQAILLNTYREMKL